MRSGWLVQFETTSLLSPVIFVRPYREWRYYRFRWVARLVVLMTNYTPPPPGIFALCSARLLGRVTSKPQPAIIGQMGPELLWHPV